MVGRCKAAGAEGHGTLVPMLCPSRRLRLAEQAQLREKGQPMRRPVKVAALVTVAAAITVGTAACTYDTHELGFDRLSCRTADQSLHTVQLVVNRSTYSVVAVTGVRGDATVKKTTTYAALTAAEAHSQNWHGPYVVTGRNGNINVRAVGSAMFNTWVETTRGNCLATGSVYWEGQIQ